jgi:hypothetical protein
VPGHLIFTSVWNSCPPHGLRRVSPKRFRWFPPELRVSSPLPLFAPRHRRWRLRPKMQLTDTMTIAPRNLRSPAHLAESCPRFSLTWPFGSHPTIRPPRDGPLVVTLEVGPLLGPMLEPVTAETPGSRPNHGQSSIVGETRPLQGRGSGPVGTSALSLGSPSVLIHDPRHIRECSPAIAASL